MDKIINVPSPYRPDSYDIRTYSLPVPELMRQLSPDGRLGNGILKQANLWYENTLLVDRYGYEMVPRDYQESYKKYKIKELQHCLDVISTFEVKNISRYKDR